MNRHLIKNLLAILDNEFNVLTSLLALEKEKNAVLVGRDLNELERVVDAENVLSETLSCLEEERIHYMEKNKFHPNLSDFIVESPEECRQDLIERQQMLVDSLRMLKIYNEMNNKILSESIKFFKYSINLFTGTGDSGKTYDLHGMENTISGPGQALVLDHKI